MSQREFRQAAACVTDRFTARLEREVRAERRLGELLKETVRQEGGRPKKRSLDVTVLPDGVSKTQSSR
jgi:hypothetical protein